jgi:PTS system nitrogen regulatory IIA component
MDLTLRDVADAFRVSEDTVARWVADNNLPARRPNGTYRFNRIELLEWAAVQRLAPSPFFRGARPSLPRLDKALRNGGALTGLTAHDRPGLLRALIAALPLPTHFDRDELLMLFTGREALGPTAIGEGIALPHPRRPIVIPGWPASITVCYLGAPLDFTAPDGQPVHTLFALLSPTVLGHVHLLARLLTALKDTGFREAVRRRAPAPELIDHARRLEDRPS